MNKNFPLIILGIIFLLLAALVVRPLFFSIKHGSENLISQKRLLIELEQKSQNIKNFQAIREARKADLDKLGQLFIDSEEPIGFIEFLEEEANHSRLSVDIVPLTLKGVSGDFWPSTNFRLELSGSFSNFLQFLDKVESSPYLIDLSNFSLNKPTQNANGNINILFQMKVYTQ